MGSTKQIWRKPRLASWLSKASDMAGLGLLLALLALSSEGVAFKKGEPVRDVGVSLGKKPSGSIALTNPPRGPFTWISAGADHAAALRADGSIVAWGSNSVGQLNVTGSGFATVIAKGNHTLALRADGTLAGWGNDGSGANNPPAGRYFSIGSGENHILAITSLGTIVTRGRNEYGQSTPPPGRFVAATGGLRHSVALSVTGQISAWGSNAYGQANAPAGTYLQVVAGDNFNVAIRSDHTLVAWGDNSEGQTQVPGGEYKQVAAGRACGLALRMDGTLVAWGDGGEAGDLVQPGKYIAIALGKDFSLAVPQATRTWSYVRLHPAGEERSNATSIKGGVIGGNIDFHYGPRAAKWTAPNWNYTSYTAGGFYESSINGIGDSLLVGIINAARAGTWDLLTGAPSYLPEGPDMNGSEATCVDGTTIGGYIHPGWDLDGWVRFACIWPDPSQPPINLSDTQPLRSYEEMVLGAAGGQQVGVSGYGACLWTGTPESFVYLAPMGSGGSYAYATDGVTQVGKSNSGADHACLWKGTRDSWVDLNPSSSAWSIGLGAFGDYQVGKAEVGGSAHAALWAGTPESFVDLGSLLDDEYAGMPSVANAVWSSGADVYVVGKAMNMWTGNYEAILWKTDDATPPDTMVSGATDGQLREMMSGETSVSNQMFLRFAGWDDEGVHNFECSVDGGPFTYVGNSIYLNNLPLGQHSVRVRSVDVYGDPDGTPASFSWTVANAATASSAAAQSLAEEGLTDLAKPFEQTVQLLNHGGSQSANGVRGQMNSFIKKANKAIEKGGLSHGQLELLSLLIPLAEEIKNSV